MICPQKEFQASALKRGRLTKRSRGIKRRRIEDQIRVLEAKTGSTLQKPKYFKLKWVKLIANKAPRQTIPNLSPQIPSILYSQVNFFNYQSQISQKSILCS